MKTARRSDEVISVPDWLFDDPQSAEVSAEVLLAHAESALETWDSPKAVHPERPQRVEGSADPDDFTDTAVYSPRHRRPAAWLLVAVGAAAALGVGSFWLNPAEPQLMECRLPVRLSDEVVAAVSGVSAKEFFADAAPVRARRGGAPEAVSKLLDSGAALQAKGKHRSALKVFEAARALAPRNADAFYGIALSRYELGHKKLAAIAAARAITHAPDHPGTTLLLGFISQEAGEWAASRRLYEEFLGYAPESESALELRSVLAQLPQR